jgi:hypothetical protein
VNKLGVLEIFLRTSPCASVGFFKSVITPRAAVYFNEGLFFSLLTVVVEVPQRVI